ncbi:MAG: beta-galactosidase [Planctomycetota bacterium]
MTIAFCWFSLGLSASYGPAPEQNAAPVGERVPADSIAYQPANAHADHSDAPAFRISDRQILGQAAAHGEGDTRYLTFNIWGWNANGTNLALFQELVDSAKLRGFNTISFSFPWLFIEPRENLFAFTWLDQRVDHIVQQGLDVQLRVTYSIPPDWIGDNYFMRKEDGSLYQGFAGHKILVISDAQVRVWMERFLGRTVERYQSRYANDPVVYYSVPFAPVFECELSHTTYLDYSPQSLADFQAWLQDKYATIGDLNSRWTTSYTDFSQIAIPLSTQYGGSAWSDWMNYRTFSLKRLFDQLALAVHVADPVARIGVQVADNAMRSDSGARGTYDIVKLVENVDWVIFESIPSPGLNFSMDVLRTIAQGKRIGQELSPPACPLGSPISSYISQALDTYNYGGDMVHFANWDWSCSNSDCIGCDVTFNVEDTPINFPGYAAELVTVAQAATQPVTTIPEPQRAMYVSTMMQYLRPFGGVGAPLGVDTYEEVKGTYQLLTCDETVPVAVITDHVFSDSPLVLDQYTQGVFLPSFNQIIADDAYASLTQANVPLYAEDSGVGTINEYGDSRTPAIFLPYPPLPIPAECLPVAIPTVSEWGMTVMCLFVLSAGTLVCMKRNQFRRDDRGNSQRPMLGQGRAAACREERAGPRAPAQNVESWPDCS